MSFTDVACAVYQYDTSKEAEADYERAVEVVKDGVKNGWSTATFLAEIYRKPCVVVLSKSEVTLLMTKEFDSACRNGTLTPVPSYIALGLAQDWEILIDRFGVGYHRLSEEEN